MDLIDLFNYFLNLILLSLVCKLRKYCLLIAFEDFASKCTVLVLLNMELN